MVSLNVLNLTIFEYVSVDVPGVTMSGSSRQTGTVPKTKHNTRSRRENPVNHIPNNLVNICFNYLINMLNVECIKP